ncbi:MAG TPA: T9SS type A sorting domain-containing protein, partial [Bacteroidia bacterium]|nr:T9SS type A sorting domain-containing protein [Bacteroidia bacterium]
PAGQMLVLQVPEAAAGEKFTIFDVTGKMLFIGRMDGMETTIDVSKLAAGMYHLQVGNGSSQRISFVKL